MKLLLVFVILASYASAQFLEDETPAWKNYKSAFKKRYNNLKQDAVMKATFLKNLKSVEEHNYLYSQGKVTYKASVNQFSDMPHEEFLQKMTGLRTDLVPENNVTSAEYEYVLHSSELPEKVDWRDVGAVGPVQNQGACGSCWTFATIGALEGQEFLRHQKGVGLSEQNLLDCAKGGGCRGGHMVLAYEYIIKNRGINERFAYPYEMKQGTCRFKSEYIGATMTNFKRLPRNDENSLKLHVATVGPIAVAFDASPRSLQMYSGGVFYDEKCSSVRLNHGVVVIGYGTENGLDYWLVKNSWGSTWGENGYFKIARNKNNHCGIATDASYPIV